MGLFFSLDTWFLSNTDTGQTIQGQFPHISATKDVQMSYAEHTALNRQKAIIQFLHGKADRLAVQVQIFDKHSLDYTIEEQLTLLELWTKRDDVWGRPPILSFWIGNAHIELSSCVMESLSGITWGQPTFFGGPRNVVLTLNLLEYQPFSLDDTGIFETRYARARDRDYYELLTQTEYRNPLMGDVIRKRNYDKPNLQVGDVVALPSIEALRKERVETKSLALATAYGKKDTPQKQLRKYMFDQRNRAYVSHVLGSY